MLVADWSRGSIKMAGCRRVAVYFATMSYEDPVKRREKGDGDLRVLLTPLSGPVYETSLHRLQRRNAEKVKSTNAEKVQEAKRRRLERNKRWKKANAEKVKEQKKRWRERNRERLREQKDRWRKANPEKVREQNERYRKADPEKVGERKQRYRKANPEKERERKERWRKANPEKVKEYLKGYRERENARLEVDEERLREAGRKSRERKQRYRKADPEKARERRERWRKANPEKVKEQRKRCRERENARLEVDEERLRETRRKARERQRRYRKAHPEKVDEQRKRERERKKVKESGKRRSERNREAENERGRRYYQAHKEQRNEARRKRYAKQKAILPPCDCGLCLACGSWAVTWQPAWHARLKAWSTPGPDSANEDQPLGELEDLPLDLLEPEAETLSIASTSEIDSELGDRLETLLADESDSEVETGPAMAPTRRSSRIAAMPTVSYLDWEEENSMLEILRRKAKLHSEAADRIVTRWELLDRRTERVDAIVEEMSVRVDPHYELDRFQTQLERQDVVMDVIVNEELFDSIGGQL